MSSIGVVLALSGAGAGAASFSCDGASTEVERAICNDPDLSSRDETIASLYASLRQHDSDNEILAEQRRWIAARDRCQSDACLREAYDVRLAQLSQAVSTDLSFSPSAAPEPETSAEPLTPTTAPSDTSEIRGVRRAAPARDVAAREPQNAAVDTSATTQGDNQTTAWGAVIAFLLVVTGLGLWRDRIRQSRRRAAFAAVSRLVAEHAKSLALKRRQLIGIDAYGTLLLKDWQKETEYFYRTIVNPRLTDRQRRIVGVVHPYNLIEPALEACGVDLSDLAPTFKGNDPVQYEHHCAEILRVAGWSARVTKASGDQGSDVIGEKNGVKVVLQCKFYSYPVGNTAVQEVAAARAHELAHYAACVTNGRYTKAARSLAATNNVALLHHDQLRDWADEIADEVDAAAARRP